MAIRTFLLCGAVCALAAAQAAAAAPVGEPAAAKLTVADMRSQLGETLQAWRAAPEPAGFAGYDRVCRPVQWKPGAPLMATEPQTVVACSYQKTLGSFTIHPSVRLQPGGQDVRRVTWYFRGGALVAVTADMTDNAYDAVVGALGQTYGPAVKTVRRTAATPDGHLPEVAMAWRGGGSLATITDPAPPRWDLRLTLAEGALAQTRTAAATPAPRG